MGRKLGETFYLDFVTHSSTTGAVTDDDAIPVVEIFEDTTDTPILTPTAVKRTSKTGNYRVPVLATAVNGFEVGKSYSVVVTATVGAIVGKGVIENFQVRANALGDTLQANVTQLGGVTQSLIDLKDFADTGYDPAAHKVQGVVLADTATTLSNAPADMALDSTVAKAATAALEVTAQSILTDTGANIPGLIAALNNLSSSDTQAACNMALVALALDHLLQVAHPTGTPVADTILDRIMNKDGNQTYNRSLQSLENLYSKIPNSSAEVIVMPLTGSTTGSVLQHREVVEVVRGDVGYIVYYQLNLGPGGTITGFDLKFGAKEKTTDLTYALGPVIITGDVVSLATDENSNVIVIGKIFMPDTSNLTPGRRYVGEINMVNASTGHELTAMQFYLNVLDDVIK